MTTIIINHDDGMLIFEELRLVLKRLLFCFNQMCIALHVVNMKMENKEISISNYTLWMDIESSFCEHYPFLKIVFTENETGMKMSKSLRIDNHLCIKQIASVTGSCTIDVNKDRSVSQVCLDFKNKLGVNVEVLRKSGNVWNVISITKNWTLENQNTAGEFICSQMANAK